MKITADEIENKLKAIWTSLEYIWIWDEYKWSLNVDAMRDAVSESKVLSIKQIGELSDCDKFAIQFMAECWRKRYFQWDSGKLPKEQEYPVAIGFAWGTMFDGEEKNHVVNIGVDKEGDVYLMDLTPGGTRLWKATSEDNVKFVFM